MSIQYCTVHNTWLILWMFDCIRELTPRRPYVMGNTNRKLSPERPKTRAKPIPSIQKFPNKRICYVCGNERSSRVLRLGPDQFICSRRNCKRLKYSLEISLSRHPVIQINHHEDEIRSIRIIGTGQDHKRPRQDVKKNVWRPPTISIADQKLLNRYPGQTFGRSELMGDSKYCRPAIDPNNKSM